MNKLLLVLIQIIALFLFWYLLSGKNFILLISVGLICSVLIVFYQNKLKMVDDESMPISILPKAVLYWMWLYKEVIQSSLYVSKLILSREMDITPQYFKIKSNQKTTMGFNIYANSITMTPGTISVIINNTSKEIDIHALTMDTKASLQNGVMDKRIKKLMGDMDV
ncbi:MAG: cation transporter [Rhodobiaceae bacterium]|nr:cation transporter [Rhodobiaceae bacterium]RPF97144.1 MAG: cation transporter [Rhizobiales bacterium TMED227]